MPDEHDMSKETFLQIAESSGLDVTDAKHMDELYAVVQGLLPNVKHLREMDLSGIEPATTYAPPTE
jgi:Asp-tRNA(Asn)/Glu-tRNA(Gln) amidotransferase C subunit